MHKLLSIDVEEWFHAENLKAAITKNKLPIQKNRIELNINKILSLLDLNFTKATFFIVGIIAKQYPSLIKEISSKGHEIACHSFSHTSTFSQNKESLLDDIKRTKFLLEDITGKKVFGYRAPNFSISNELIEVLQELDFLYDSSYLNSRLNKRYGNLNNIIPPKNIFKLNDNFYEFPLSIINFSSVINIPWSGGFLFRFIPYSIFKEGVNSILKKYNYYSFYIHTWEFDAEQPRVEKLNFNYRFRHYYNLINTEKKFSSIIKDYNFTTYENCLGSLSLNTKINFI